MQTVVSSDLNGRDFVVALAAFETVLVAPHSAHVWVILSSLFLSAVGTSYRTGYTGFLPCASSGTSAVLAS